MKTQKLLLLALATLSLQSCARNGNDVWEDTKSAGRHVKRGVCALGGKHGDSRQVSSCSEFEYVEDGQGYEGVGYQDGSYQDLDYIPLEDQAHNFTAAPSEMPGDPGSSVPGISAFRDPVTMPHLAGIFQTIYFEYDSSLIKGAQNLRNLHAIADYMRRHPNVYLFIEGHTDERGPQAYNLALGARRSNSVRNLLVNEGVNPNNVFTISYGKERPVVLERNEEGWARNRRAEFKVYER